ncbi:MAG: DUF4870 domain-containing protein [Chloroflexi bacterium]|nr:DUF4870 domain-containing protein [Chloroflexota bacterium]
MAKTSTGLDENVAGLLCYVAWWISGLVFFLLEKDNKFIRFHALQSMIAFGILTLASIIIGWIAWIPIFGWLVGTAFWILCLVVWIICMVKAYQGEKFKLPWAGNLAEKNI